MGGSIVTKTIRLLSSLRIGLVSISSNTPFGYHWKHESNFLLDLHRPLDFFYLASEVPTPTYAFKGSHPPKSETKRDEANFKKKDSFC